MTKRDKPRMVRDGDSGWLCAGKFAFAFGPTMEYAYSAWLIREQEWESIIYNSIQVCESKPAPFLLRSASSLSLSEWVMIAVAAVGVALAMWTI